jgi:hypothetical protein
MKDFSQFILVHFKMGLYKLRPYIFDKFKDFGFVKNANI